MMIRKAITDLESEESDVLIIAVIIFAQEPRTLNSRGEPRAVWNLTLRDSPNDTINLTIWGSPAYVHGLAESFQFGDVVEVQNPRILPSRTDEGADRYAPEVSSPFQLSLSEGQSNKNMILQLHDAPPDELEELQSLLAIPTKHPQSFVSLSDIHNSASSVNGTELNLLVAVRSVGLARSVETNDSRQTITRTVSVFDGSGVSNALPMQIWNSILSERAAFWTPRETVLFIADARLTLSNYHRGLLIRLTARSIVTENPQTEEAAWLRESARSSPLDAVTALNQFASSFDPNLVQKVMSVSVILARCRAAQQVMQRSESSTDENANAAGGSTAASSVGSSAASEDNFTAVIYAAVTRFDIDGPAERTLKITCSLCHTILPGYNTPCCSPGCVNRMDQAVELSYDLRVDITDHTGTLRNCRLIGKAAQIALGCTEEQYLGLSEEMATELKWSYLLERVVARAVIVQTSPRWQRPLVSLLSLDVADPDDVARRLPML